MEGASSVSFDCNATVSNDDDAAEDDDDDSVLPAAFIMRKEGMRPRRHRAIAILIFSLLCHFQKKSRFEMSVRCRTGNPFMVRTSRASSFIRPRLDAIDYFLFSYSPHSSMHFIFVIKKKRPWRTRMLS
jgi:hypothetical protein